MSSQGGGKGWGIGQTGEVAGGGGGGGGVCALGRLGRKGGSTRQFELVLLVKHSLVSLSETRIVPFDMKGEKLWLIQGSQVSRANKGRRETNEAPHSLQ